MANVFLNSILFLITYISCINLNSLNSNSRDRISPIHAINITFKNYRRQQGMPPNRMPPVMPGMMIKTGEDDGYYEPYWENGDWVFNRQTSTNRPQGHFLNKGDTTKHRECNQICLVIYVEYGPVCGTRLTRDEWTYENKTFQNMCYLEFANCEHALKTWFPSKKGNCSEGMTTHPTNSTAILMRLSTWLKNYTTT